MNRTLLVKIQKPAKSTFPIYIGNNLIDKINTFFNLEKYSSVFIITDSIIKTLFAKKLMRLTKKETNIVSVAPGEKHKNIETVQQIWNQMLQLNGDRKSLVLDIGGGVITDMGGFTASTYMRGIDFIQIPTTLLSMVDASVGGKVGIDFADIKNLIGSFNQPIGVIIDIDFLKTLPEREFNAGFAEIIKHGLIYDKKYFNFVTSKKPKDFSDQEIAKIIFRSCQIKSDIVSKDEKESGIRKLLNFGHTIGHAIESLSLETNNSLLHGEAINIGMLVETKISQLVGNMSESEYQQIKKVLINTNLPIEYKNIDINNVLKKIKKDKKSESGNIQWTLLKNIGYALINQSVSEEQIKNAFKKVYEFKN